MKNLQAINTEMILKIQEQAEKLAFYENLHSPSIYKEHSNTPKKGKPCKKDFLSSKEGSRFKKNSEVPIPHTARCRV